MNKNMSEWLILTVFALIVLLVIPVWTRMLLVFILCSCGILFSIIQLRKQINIAQTIIYSAIAILAFFAMLNTIGYFMETFLWVNITVITIMTLLSLGFLIVMAIKLGQWIYHAFKKPNKPVD